VLFLCGIVTSAPTMLVSRNSAGRTEPYASAITPIGITATSIPRCSKNGL
jgi:hypothetical protein